MLLTTDDPRLTAYALGELSPRERAEVEAALAQQPELRAEVEAIRALAGQLEADFAAELRAPAGGSAAAALSPELERALAEIAAPPAAPTVAALPAPAAARPAEVIAFPVPAPRHRGASLRLPTSLRKAWPSFLAAAAALLLFFGAAWLYRPEFAGEATTFDSPIAKAEHSPAAPNRLAEKLAPAPGETVAVAEAAPQSAPETSPTPPAAADAPVLRRRLQVAPEAPLAATTTASAGGAPTHDDGASTRIPNELVDEVDLPPIRVAATTVLPETTATNEAPPAVAIATASKQAVPPGRASAVVERAATSNAGAPTVAAPSARPPPVDTEGSAYAHVPGRVNGPGVRSGLHTQNVAPLGESRAASDRRSYAAAPAPAALGPAGGATVADVAGEEETVTLGTFSTSGSGATTFAATNTVGEPPAEWTFAATVVPGEGLADHPGARWWQPADPSRVVLATTARFGVDFRHYQLVWVGDHKYVAWLVQPLAGQATATVSLRAKEAVAGLTLDRERAIVAETLLAPGRRQLVAAIPLTFSGAARDLPDLEFALAQGDDRPRTFTLRHGQRPGGPQQLLEWVRRSSVDKPADPLPAPLLIEQSLPPSAAQWLRQLVEAAAPSPSPTVTPAPAP